MDTPHGATLPHEGVPIIVPGTTADTAREDGRQMSDEEATALAKAKIASHKRNQEVAQITIDGYKQMIERMNTLITQAGILNDDQKKKIKDNITVLTTHIEALSRIAKLPAHDYERIKQQIITGEVVKRGEQNFEDEITAAGEGTSPAWTSKKRKEQIGWLVAIKNIADLYILPIQSNNTWINDRTQNNTSWLDTTDIYAETGADLRTKLLDDYDIVHKYIQEYDDATSHEAKNELFDKLTTLTHIRDAAMRLYAVYKKNEQTILQRPQHTP